MYANPIIEKLQRKESIYGTMIDEISNPLVIPLLSRAGFDFAVIDMEHGAFTIRDIVNFVIASKNCPISIIVRTPGKDPQMISKILDNGAHGIMVPHVETKAEVQSIIQASKYPPIGIRGYGPRGIITDYETIPCEEKVRIINQNIVIWIQIESVIAIEKLDMLLSFPDINGVIIGPMDLSLSMGIPGQMHDIHIQQAFQKVLAQCNQKGVPCGIHFKDLAKSKEWKAKGMNICLYSTAFELLFEKAKKDLSELKESR